MLLHQKRRYKIMLLQTRKDLNVWNKSNKKQRKWKYEQKKT
jgi:hypothetical protein